MSTTPKPRTHRASAQRRRAALLDAARELIGEIGAGAITHRAVAQRAGVPLSTTSYFFSSIDELVAEAIREQRHEQIRSFDDAERIWVLSDGEPTRDVLRRIAEQLSDRPATEKATNVETYLAAGRDPSIAETVASVTERFRERIGALTPDPDAQAADDVARTMLGLVLGASLHQVAGLGTDAGELARGLELLIAGALLGEEERNRLLGELDERRRSRVSSN